MVKIQWGKYRDTAGPYTYGASRIVNEPCAELRVIAATEGGSWDAVNMFDKGIVSVGCLQVIENRLGYVTQLFKELKKSGVEVNKFLTDATGISFLNNQFVLHGKTDARYVWLLGSDQKSWSSDQTEHAMAACKAMSETLALPAAITAQRKWLRSGFLQNFLFEPAKTLMANWKTDQAPQHQYALYLAYLSFACNLPARAAGLLRQNIQRPNVGSPEWCQHMFYTLAAKSGIDIWPERARKIAPVIEQITGYKFGSGPAQLGISVRRAQEILVKLGAKIAVDGAYGRLTREAVRTFQRSAGLIPDGIIGPKTREALLRAETP